MRRSLEFDQFTWDPTNLESTRQKMKSCRTAQEYNLAAEEVKKANGGRFPNWWADAIVGIVPPRRRS